MSSFQVTAYHTAGFLWFVTSQHCYLENCFARSVLKKLFSGSVNVIKTEPKSTLLAKKILRGKIKTFQKITTQTIELLKGYSNIRTQMISDEINILPDYRISQK